jgi:hypothetical protein
MMPGMIGTSQPWAAPVLKAQVVLRVEEHVGDGKVRAPGMATK